MDNFFTGLGLGIVPWYVIVIAAVCAYFLGNVNPAILIGRARGVDIRAQGSGNAGTTNALRSLGKKAGALTFVIDVIKGWAGYYVPLLICMGVALNNEGLSFRTVLPLLSEPTAFVAWNAAVYAPAMLCGLCVVLGHMYPAAFGFRGGKGVATAFGVLLGVSWAYALILLAVVVVFTAIFRRVSLSVLIAVAVALAIVFYGYAQTDTGFFHIYNTGFMIFSTYMPLWIIILLALVVWKHRGNIKRLIKGEEPKLSFGSDKGKVKGDEK